MLNKFLPSFRTTCFITGFLNITFFLMMISEGVMNSMAQFNIPASTLASPHYADAMFWVFLHMAMIGVIIILLGWVTDNPVKKLWVSRIFVVIFTIYATLDIRTSDNMFGTALYQGEGSLFPVFVDFFYILLFLRLSFTKKIHSQPSMASNS